MKVCSVKDCTITSLSPGRPNLFIFPKRREREVFQKWVKFCMDPTINNLCGQRVRRYICQNHFHGRDYITSGNTTRLMKGAYPKINAPQTNTHHETTVVNKLPCDSVQSHYPLHELELSPETVKSPRTPPQKYLTYCKRADEPKESYISKNESRCPTLDKKLSPCSTLESTNLGTEKESCISTTTKKSPLKLKKHNFARLAQMKSLREKFLYRYIRKKEKELKLLKKKYQNSKNQLTHLSGIKDPLVGSLDNISRNMTPSSVLLMKAQLRCGKKKPKGRRWSLEEKTLALSIYKQSPKAYSLLQCIMALPSKRTLKYLINRVLFKTGINEHIFKSLHESLKPMREIEKLCVLCFDEMSVKECVQYNSAEDCILGFEDNVDWKSNKIADHVQVFLVRGIVKKWKQPIAFYFNRGGSKSDILVDQLLSVLKACLAAGLKVLGTVCGMGSSNVKTMKSLGSTKTKPYFIFNKQRFLTFFDPPHLIKCTRNMFLQQNVKVNDTIEGLAEWNHILKAFEWDKKAAEFRMLHHITESHLNPRGKEKLRVYLAAQILSHRVAACVNTAVRCGVLSEEALATAIFAKQVDDMFDSLNGGKLLYKKPHKRNKSLRGAVTSTSQHFQFWEAAIEYVEKWTFIKLNGSTVSPPPQKGWITTLRAASLLWTQLKEEYGLEYFSFRNINQDPLENLFGAVRSNCGSKNNPTTSQFVDALKTSIISGLAFEEIRGGNCLNDGAELLTTLRNLVESEAVTNSHHQQEHSATVTKPQLNILLTEEPTPEAMLSTAYITSYVTKRLLSSNKCDSCRQGLCVAYDFDYFHAGIYNVEYEGGEQKLTYPSKLMVKTVVNCANIVDMFLNENAHLSSLKENLINEIRFKVNLSFLNNYCSVHFEYNVTGILENVTYLCIKWWCKRKNRILSRTETSRIHVRTIKSNSAGTAEAERGVSGIMDTFPDQNDERHSLGTKEPLLELKEIKTEVFEISDNHEDQNEEPSSDSVSFQIKAEPLDYVQCQSGKGDEEEGKNSCDQWGLAEEKGADVTTAVSEEVSSCPTEFAFVKVEPGCSRDEYYQEEVERGNAIEFEASSVLAAEKTLTCTRCGKSFSCSKTLKRHMLIVHSTLKSYRCCKCGDSYDQREALRIHVVTVHRKIYSCHVCDKTFCHNENLKRHLTTVHSKVKSFECEKCHKTFSCNSSLVRHMKLVHEGEKAFKCELCEKMYMTKVNLKMHMTIVHEGIKCFKCEKCEKMFGRKDKLLHHMITVHEKVKAYKCEKCEKTFSEKGTLKRHVNNVHDGLKSFSCEKCDKMFAQKVALIRHQTAFHEGVRPFKCPSCDKSFARKDYLTHHLPLHFKA